jgi:hypothetical protein
MTHIENSDRGITINKSLAWTMATGLLGMGLYTGLQIATIATQLGGIVEQVEVAATARGQLETRLRMLEQSKARDDERFSSILAFMAQIDARLERMEDRK